MTLFFIGLFGGLLSSFLGIGAGSFFVPILVLFYQIPQLTSQGYSLAVIFPISLLSAFIYFKKGAFDVTISRELIIFAILGVVLGSFLATIVPTTVLRKLFGIVLMYAAIRNWHSMYK